MPDMQVDAVTRLDDAQARAVAVLAEAATVADGVSPLSEHVLLHVRNGSAADEDGHSPAHLLAQDQGRLVGYAHLDTGEPAEGVSAEVVVHPEARRRGVGRALVAALRSAAGAGPLRLWSHGHLEAARDFAAADGFTSVRELWQMRRPLGADAPPLAPVSLPDGFAARAFSPGRDEQTWLSVNARAFASHPEQGRMTLDDLLLREAEPWFDPAGFILIEQVSPPPPALAAFHWTKVHGHDGGVHPPVGEVYVVGVDPSYQGSRLGRAVTLLGLHHLQDQGLSSAMLYVDGDNKAAVATYTRLGFEQTAVDVMYSPAVHRSVQP
jgi:mycothiol synthase